MQQMGGVSVHGIDGPMVRHYGICSTRNSTPDADITNSQIASSPFIVNYPPQVAKEPLNGAAAVKVQLRDTSCYTTSCRTRDQKRW